VETGGESWFFITADYAFGHALERDTAAVVEEFGGEVVGTVRHPFPGSDFSSFLLQAQASGAQIIGLANAGGDTVNTVKQAAEFGIVQAGQNLAALLMFITDVHAIGLERRAGPDLHGSVVLGSNDVNREFAEEFAAQHRGNKPTMVQAGVYSSVIHYLKAVEELGSAEDGAAVVEQMKENADRRQALRRRRSPRGRPQDPRHVPLRGQGSGRFDRAPWDYYNLRATIPAAEAFRPLERAAALS
jgi:branched-chain amino acid transport system substrate-binding protein